MQITEMQPNDLEQVAALASQLGYSCSLNDLRRRYGLIQPRPSHALLVAKKGTQVLGWIHLTIETPSLLGEPRADVSGLVVDEACRGRGIGKALLQAGEAWAKSKGLSLVRIRTNTKRTDAHRFYGREGYAIQKSWHLFTKEV